VTTDVEASSGADTADRTGELRLRATGRAGARRFRWHSRRAAPPARLDGPAVADLARTVDLTSCAGSMLRVFFPPIHYATTVKPHEAATIVAALRELRAALT